MTVDSHIPQDFDQTVHRLAVKAIDIRKQKPDNQRTLIAISGIPGSGKTTLASRVADKIKSLVGRDDVATVIPMDGFHYYRSQLAAMPDPATAIHRRGAAFTFDADRFHSLVRALREPVSSSSSQDIYAPSFDHALKDPVEDDISVSGGTRIVLLEGLYLGLDREPWSTAARLMDESWFVEADREVARARLIKRHVETGIVEDEAAAAHRVDTTDLLNADDILANRSRAQEMVCTTYISN